MDTVRERGVLRCGVREGITGFSAKDAAGRWQGLDVDFCRAVAAAVLGDGERVDFVALRSSTRFPALQARQIDLLVRNTTWTLAREGVLKVQFPAIFFYDGQGFMVPTASGIASPDRLNGATLCVERGTNHGRNLERYAAKSGLSFTPLVLDSAQEVAAAFFAGRYAAYTSDASQLAAARLSAPGGPDAYVILPERISREPLAPVAWGGDPEWTTVVRWVLYALLIAEDEGITRENVVASIENLTGELTWLSSQERGS
jgi:general L-amino acid transport system substrate-binding protein